MNKLLLGCMVSGIMMFSAGAYAQKCDFETDEADPFTKEHVRASGLIRISGVPRWWVKMEQKGAKKTMALTIFKMKEVKANIARGTKMQIKLEDGTVLEPTVAEDATPTFNVEQQMYIVSQWNVTLELSEDMLQQLSKSPIELIRTKVGSEECNMPDAVGRNTKKVMELAKCMLNNK